MVSIAAGTTDAVTSPATKVACRNAAFRLAVSVSTSPAVRTRLTRIKMSIVIAQCIPVNVGMATSSAGLVSTLSLA
jgi:hypothetical protein